MSRPTLEVADIFREHGLEYAQLYGSAATPIINAIIRCRTAALGGHVYRCSNCGKQEISYNSCRNRHCPKCQGERQAKWAEARVKELLPVRYFHVVFTLPHEVAELALRNKTLIYELLFKAASKTLLAVATKNLGLKLGFFGILHTWSQTLQLHPHIHFVVPACGFNQNGIAKRLKKKILLPVFILSRVFRGKFISLLKRARGKLDLMGELECGRMFEEFISRLSAKAWVVYAKRPFKNAEVVLKYLARYTHRVAISNSRILAHKNGTVTFSYRAAIQQRRCMTLPALLFMRRFLLHALPKGFQRIRYFGWMNNRSRKTALGALREACGKFVPQETAHNAHTRTGLKSLRKD